MNYEISNWARPGHECRHNLLYWAQGDYLGFGCAAHSHRDGRRWWNVRTPERYIDADRRGRVRRGGVASISTPTSGASRASSCCCAPAPASLADALPEGLDDLVEPQGDRLVLTVRGRLLANEVALRLS